MMNTLRMLKIWTLPMVLGMLCLVASQGMAEVEVHEHQHQVHSELEFLVEMIPHHQEAVDSAKQVMAMTERQEIRDFAKEIIEVQTQEITKMRQWLELWHPDATIEAAYQPMMRDIQGLSPQEADIVFLEDMIEHHLAAVHMAHDVLDKNLTEQPELQALAEEIIRAQNREIELMRNWLEQWTGAPAPVFHHGH